MVAYPDRGAGSDPKLFFFFFFLGGVSLSPPRLNIFTMANMGEVMFLVGLVCLSVCLSVDIITQKVMKGFGRNFMEGSWVKK